MDMPDRLTRAAENGDAAAVARLLDAGAEADAPNSVRRTALDLAVNAGHVDVVRLLLAAGRIRADGRVSTTSRRRCSGRRCAPTPR
ncbi:ankyrin repeat domain-containing protein [Streptomyces sp. NPDC002466]|uniref:ankyrin repeat domain-containing protein n=2 Tax=unclassified Streptomyces TaxID=2593676 RepID=UPI0035DC7A2C